MILADGKVYDSAAQGEILKGLERKINATRAEGQLLPETVIAAVEILRNKILAGEFAERINELTDSGVYGAENLQEQIAQAAELLKREHLEYKLQIELGSSTSGCGGDKYKFQSRIQTRIMPLGTLFHIAAGNMDGLPVYSVLEGLLAGNVNILKLPQADKGLSVEILVELIKIEPGLAPYLYVFDTPSEDVEAMRQMADMSDGIVVWGGDEAVRAVRHMANPGVKLIEWGHKLGFAYLSGYEDKERELTALAEHIGKTRQLLCSSCQVIFIDTEDMEELYGFCQEFLPYLQRAADKYLQTESDTIGTRAELSLRRYSDEVEKVFLREPGKKAAASAVAERRRVWYGRGCSLTAMGDSALECSYMFGNCLVKRLPRDRVMTQLRRYKGVLQTVGLICDRESREELTDLLAACGLTRIMRAGSQSDAFVGEAHDGEYALRRYVRAVDVERDLCISHK